MTRLLTLTIFTLALADPALAQDTVLHVSGSAAIVAEGARRTIEVRDLATGKQLWSAPGPAHPQFAVSSGGSAADVPPSAANGAAVEPLRASVCLAAFSGPAPGMAGDRGGDLAGAAPSAATCKPVSSPSGPRSRAA